MSKPLNKVSSKEVELSIVILTYNNETQLPVCLDSIYKFNYLKLKNKIWEIIVADNNSSDNTVSNLEKDLKKYPNLLLIKNSQNLGFGPGNNLAANQAIGKYILFLNPDTKTEKDTINFPLEFISSHPDVGAVSVKTILGNGLLDYTCHRGFPTPWNSLCYFLGLSKLLPKSKLFSGYTLSYLDLDSPHEVDAINGAFFLMPSNLGRRLGFFDTDFYWKGEDLDLCFRIKSVGYKITYLPQVRLHHFKGSSLGHRRGSKTLEARFEVMRQFYDKHYSSKYPSFVRTLVFIGIHLRYLIAYLTGK